MVSCSPFRALARSAGALRVSISKLTVFVTVAAATASAQDSSVAVEQAIRVVGTDGSTQIVEMDASARTRLAAGPDSAELTSVPLANGRYGDFSLQRFEVFPADAELVANDGKTTTPIARPEVVYYRGQGISDPAETIFLSVDKTSQGEMHMLSSHPKRGASVITPQRDAYGRTVHRLSEGGDNGLEAFACGSDLLPETQEAVQNLVEPDHPVDARSLTTLQAELLVDVSNYLYTSAFGSDQNRALSYVGNLFGACSAIYQRDINVVLTVKTAHVWTSADPFDGASSSAQLSNYVNWNKANRANVARDAAHYLGGRRSYGGIAYVGGICSTSYGYGVSNIYGTYTYPTTAYTWDVNCITHELGHNFNSPHTHCYSPPIDCCYANECACGTAAPDAGTIMSYCHLLNGGRGVGMYFHSRTVSVMRTYAEQRTCLTAYSGGGTGGGTGDGGGGGGTPTTGTPKAIMYGNSVQIANGDWTPSVSDGTKFGSARVGGGDPGVSRTFTIWNSGTANLNLTGAKPVVITGTHKDDFVVLDQPAPGIAAKGADSFRIAFRPTGLGTRSAMVYIPTNDPTNTLYSFWLTGEGEVNAPKVAAFSGNSAIPDANGTGLYIPISVGSFPGLLADVNVRFGGTSCSNADGAAGVGLTHTNMSDLHISLISPRGTEVLLMGGAGGTGNNLCQVLFDDQGGGSLFSAVSAAAAPWSGSYQPVSPLYSFNGQDPNGTWYVRVRDLAAGNTGSVRSVSLELAPADYSRQNFVNTGGWVPTGANKAGFVVTDHDPVRQSLRAWVGAQPNQPRVIGWMSNDAASSLKYGVVGRDRYVRAKFHVYAGGQSANNVNKIPNLRMRVGNRFAVASVLEVLHHSNSDPQSSNLGFDFRPSWDPSKPSVYRVDFDPIDVPYLVVNAATESISRMFEAYATEPQEDGYVALAESSISSYPALPEEAAIVKRYSPTRNDFAGTIFNRYNIMKPVTYPPAVQTTGADLPRATKDAYGLHLDTLLVPTNKMGVVTADIIPGAASEDNDPARRVRIQENKIYKIRFHATSAQATNAQAHIRFRARTAKFGWVQKLEVGGAWAVGTNPATGNAAIAQQALPGIGNQNPDQINSADPGSYYTLLMHSPMSRDIRTDYGNVPLSTSMPNLSAQDGPGVNTGKTRRDVVLGLDIIDTFSPGTNAYLEKGQVNLDGIEIQVYDRVGD